MPSMFIRPLAPLLFAAAAVAGVSNVSAAPLTGVPATDSWSLVGNSLDTTNVIWSRGTATVDFNAYITNFALSLTDAFTGSAQGSPVGSLVGNGWVVGDRIVGLGISSTRKLNSATFKVDLAGTGTWTPAANVGGGPGVASQSAGGNGTIASQSIQSASTYAPLATYYKNLSGVNFVPGPGFINFASALRTWAVDFGSDAFNYSSMQWLVNYDELTRLGVPVANFGSSSKFSINASGPVAGLAAGNNEGADVVFSRSLAFPTVGGTVPEPGSLALMALALLGLGVARRRV